MLTKLDVAALRHAEDLTVHLSRTSPDGIVRLIKRKDHSKPFDTDKEHILTAKVQLYGMRGRDELASGAASCFAMRGIYHNQHSHLSLIIKTLRVGDELTFVFWPDAHTNGYVAAAGLHGDALYLYVRRDGTRIAEWEIETSITPSNSARMCRGVPNSEHYASDAAEARMAA